jgi:ZIP family zinc transporter
MDHIWIALALTLFAGMATGIGSALAFATKRTNYRFLSIATGFSAGVMIYVSFVEILPEAFAALASEYGDSRGSWAAVGAFFAGIAFIGLIDYLIPAAENPHETHSEAEMAPLHDPSAPVPSFEFPENGGVNHAGTALHNHDAGHHRLMRMGLFTALAITIHNIPEGLATFFTALQDPAVGLAIAIAVALHNIPEGVSVSVPIYYATGSRTKAFVYSLLSGLAEFVGALIALGVLRVLLGGNGIAVPWHLVGILLGTVAGIMVYISLDELLPTSRAYGKGHDSLLGLVAGMAMMALSLLLMQ